MFLLVKVQDIIEHPGYLKATLDMLPHKVIVYTYTHVWGGQDGQGVEKLPGKWYGGYFWVIDRMFCIFTGIWYPFDKSC